jgi:homoserine kinase
VIGGSVTVFAPATVANLGVGLDVFGLAIEGPGDTVTATIRERRSAEEPVAQLVSITGEPGVTTLPPCSPGNTACIAAACAVRAADVDVVVELALRKGLPVGSGLGSSAASSAAAAQATSLALGAMLTQRQLLEACLEAEEAVSGSHADNIAPALLGGLILVRRTKPVDVLRLPIPDGLRLAIVCPALEILTRDARAVLAPTVTLQAAIHHSANVAAFVAACYSGDLDALGRCIEDPLAEPARIHLIPGGAPALGAMRAAGALGASLSGSGPTLFALCRSLEIAADAARAGVEALAAAGVNASSFLSRADCPGARQR